MTDDGRGRLETAVWAVVLLVPLAGLVWEFGTSILTSVPGTSNLPLAIIEDLEVTMYLFVIVLGGGTLLAFVYAAIRYADNGESRPSIMPPNWRQGTFAAWIAIVVAALLVTGIAGGTVLLNIDSGPSTAAATWGSQGELTYKVVGVQWTWMVGAKHLPTMQRRIIRVPANTTIHLRITSKDVIHSFAIQELGVKKDAVPGQWNHYSFMVREPGEYQINCAELCGAGHSQMTPTLVVMPRDEYAQWVVDNGGTNPFNETNTGTTTMNNSSNGSQSANNSNTTATASSAINLPPREVLRDAR